MVPFAISGTLLSLKGKHIPVKSPLPAVLVTKVPGSGQFPYLVCLTQQNEWYVVTAADVVGLHADIPRIQAVDHLEPPTALLPKPGQSYPGSDETAPHSRLHPHASPPGDDGPRSERPARPYAGG